MWTTYPPTDTGGSDPRGITFWHIGFSGILSQGKKRGFPAGYHPDLGCFSHRGCTLWDPESSKSRTEPRLIVRVDLRARAGVELPRGEGAPHRGDPAVARANEGLVGFRVRVRVRGQGKGEGEGKWMCVWARGESEG